MGDDDDDEGGSFEQSLHQVLEDSQPSLVRSWSGSTSRGSQSQVVQRTPSHRSSHRQWRNSRLASKLIWCFVRVLELLGSSCNQHRCCH